MSIVQINLKPIVELKQQPSAVLDINKVQKKIRHLAGEAVVDFGMIKDGHKIMVCLSGGADSYVMLDTLMHLQRVAPISFEIIAVNLDQKQPDFPEHILPEYLESVGVNYHIVERDTYSIVKDKIPEGKTTCGLCSRLRRGALYGTARELGADSIALGHHADDRAETLFLNMFFGGRLASMPPKLLSDDGENMVIRPLSYVRESLIKQYAEHKQFPIIPCNLCGSQDNLQRVAVKKMFAEWDQQYPGRVENICRSMENLSLSHLADSKLFDFEALERTDV